MKNKINIALCMNSKEAKVLGMQLIALNFNVKVYVCCSLNEFIECISTNSINCFIFDYNYKKFNIIEMAEKLRKTPHFCRSSIIFTTEADKSSEPFQHFKIKIDMVIPRPFVKENYSAHLAEIWQKQLSRIIPENLSVLILDNNPGILEVMAMHMLELNHKNFVTCTTVKEAKSMLQNKDFDLLLLDWDLDDGTFKEVIDMARSESSSKRLNDALAIVITGRNDVEDIMTLVQMNVKDHIIKPFDYGEFEDKIFYAIERHQKRIGQ